MRPRKTGVAAIAIGACLSVAGCGQQAQTSPAAQSSGQGQGPGITADQAQRQDAATRWVSGYCTAAGELVQTLTTMPTVDPGSPERAVQTSSELLSVMIDGLGRTVDELGRLGPAPGNEGDAVRQGLAAQLGQIRERAVATKAKVDGAPPNSADSREAIGMVRVPLDDLGKLKLLDGFGATPELDTATRRAPSCAELATKAAPPPSAPPG